MQSNNARQEYINYSKCSVLYYEESESFNGFEVYEVKIKGFKQFKEFAGIFHSIKEMDDEFKKANLFRVGGSKYYINPESITRYTVANAEEVGEGDYIFEFANGLEIEIRMNFVYFDYFKNTHFTQFKFIRESYE